MQANMPEITIKEKIPTTTVLGGLGLLQETVTETLEESGIKTKEKKELINRMNLEIELIAFELIASSMMKKTTNPKEMGKLKKEIWGKYLNAANGDVDKALDIFEQEASRLLEDT